MSVLLIVFIRRRHKPVPNWSVSFFFECLMMTQINVGRDKLVMILIIQFARLPLSSMFTNTWAIITVLAVIAVEI